MVPFFPQTHVYYVSEPISSAFTLCPPSGLVLLAARHCGPRHPGPHPRHSSLPGSGPSLPAGSWLPHWLPLVYFQNSSWSDSVTMLRQIMSICCPKPSNNFPSRSVQANIAVMARGTVYLWVPAPLGSLISFLLLRSSLSLFPPPQYLSRSDILNWNTSFPLCPKAPYLTPSFLVV